MDLCNDFKITVNYVYWSEIINKQKTCKVACDRYFFQIYTSKDQAVEDERKRCENSFGRCDNSEVSWNRCTGVWMQSGSRGGRLIPGQLTAKGCICFYIFREMKVRREQVVTQWQP